MNSGHENHDPLPNLNTMLTLSYQNAEVYKISFRMVKEVYTLIKLFPEVEQFVPVIQFRSAAVSVSINPAECASRKSLKEKRDIMNYPGVLKLK
jgi:hypothetical protein